MPSRTVQFSVSNLLAVLTIASLVFALYFGIGRALGMSNAEIGQFGLLRFFYVLPMVALWAVGLVIALRRRQQDPRRARLLIAAFSGMILTAFAIDIAQMVMIHHLSRGSGEYSQLLYASITMASVLLNVTWWILLLVAIFSRWHDDSSTDSNDIEPPTS